MSNVYLDKHISTYTHFLFYIKICGDIDKYPVGK